MGKWPLQLDAATATLHEAIDLLENSRGGGGLTVVFSAGRKLYPWRAEPAMQDVVADMHPIDLIVCGTVAVNRQGVRIGKGAGYSDIEVGLLAEAGLIGPTTTIVTTVHQMQVVDEPQLHHEHDFTLDYIVTPEEVISCGPAYCPRGLVWPNLGEEQIAAIPVLAAMADER